MSHLENMKSYSLQMSQLRHILSETREYLEIVEKDLSSIMSSKEDNQCFNI